MNWTDERVELLKKLWAEGLSASQIAAQLGGVSRNAVIGKVHRLKLSGRGKTTKAQPRARKPVATTTAAAAAPVRSAPRATVEKTVAQQASPSMREAAARPAAHATVGANALKVEFVADAIAQIETRPQVNVVVPMSRHLTLLQLTETTCKWPVGDPLSEDFYFCGADSGEAGPYCGYHSKIAFQPISERRRARA